MIKVFTLNWKGADKLQKLKPGLYKNLKDHDFQWYIKENGSRDSSIDIIKSWKQDNINLYEFGHNRDNFAQGMNYLAKKAALDKNDLILLLNNDVEFVSENSISNMVKLMEKTDAGVVGARLLYSETNKLQHAGVIFGERYGRMPYHFRHKEESDNNAKKNRYFQAVTAAVCLIKAESFLNTNGFDDRYSWSFEDIDLCLTIGKNGEKIVYCGNTEIYHEESASLKKNPVNKMFLEHNVKLFKQKWFGNYKLDHELYLKDYDYNIIK